MPECVFAERRLNSTRRSTEPSRSSGSKPSNGSGATGATASTSCASADEERAIARLGERVRDREVGDGRCEEHRAVRLLRPEVAEDVARALRVRQVTHEPRDPLALAAVELADVERALAADEDAARRQVVRAEVHERADRPLLADPRGDHRLVDAVLERDDEAVRREAGRDRVERRAGVLALHGEQDGAEPVGQLGRQRPPARAR